jgi:hypothetical protein
LGQLNCENESPVLRVVAHAHGLKVRGGVYGATEP